jgi:hypothetical protein
VSAVTTIDTAAVLKMPVRAQRELIDAILDGLGAHGIVHLELPDGPLHRYLPVPNARELAEESLRNASPEELAESLRRANDPDHMFMSIEEVLKIGEEEDQPPASPAPSAPSVGTTAG